MASKKSFIGLERWFFVVGSTHLVAPYIMKPRRNSKNVDLRNTLVQAHFSSQTEQQIEAHVDVESKRFLWHCQLQTQTTWLTCWHGSPFKESENSHSFCPLETLQLLTMKCGEVSLSLCHNWVIILGFIQCCILLCAVWGFGDIWISEFRPHEYAKQCNAALNTWLF